MEDDLIDEFYPGKEDGGGLDDVRREESEWMSGRVLTAPMPLLAPVMRTVFPSKRDALKTDMGVKNLTSCDDESS